MSLYLRALHEAGHAVVAKTVGHEVYRIRVGDDAEGNEDDYCDSGWLLGEPTMVVLETGT